MNNAVFETFDEFRRIAVGSHRVDDKEIRLAGLLFMRPEQEITKNEILPNLKYFDLRSGKYIDFTFPGWIEVDNRGKKWAFQNKAFIRCCDVISAETTWKYSGGIDLLLFTTRRIPRRWAIHDDLDVDFSGSMNIPIHQLVQKHLVEGVDVLFERIFSFAKNYEGSDPILGISIQEARVSAIRAFVDAILSYLLPKAALDRLDYAKNFVVQDIARPAASRRLRIKGKIIKLTERTYRNTKREYEVIR